MLLVLLAASLCHAAEPLDLLKQAQTAAREQLKLTARYLGREDIREYEVKPNGHKTLRRWTTYEASVMEGAPYYRLVAIKGKPLSKAQEQMQEAAMAHELQYRRRTPHSERRNRSRYSASIQHVIEHHDLELLGEEQMGGRKTWVIQSHLRPAAPFPAKFEDLMLSGDARLWIDQETGVLVRWRLNVTRSWNSWHAGSTDEKISMVLAHHEGKPIFVVKEMSARVPLEKGSARLTVQSFSEYKRFEADSFITFEP